MRSKVRTNVRSAVEDADVEGRVPALPVVFDDTRGELGVGVGRRPSFDKGVHADGLPNEGNDG
jgi:hypothetical protein